MYIGEPIKAACSRKELSCIIANMFVECGFVCENGLCSELGDDDLVIGGLLAGTDDEYALIKMTDYGFEYYGDPDVLNTIKKARCLTNGTVDIAKKDGGAVKQGDIPPSTEISES